MQKEDSKELKSSIGSKKCNIKEVVGAYITSKGEIRTVFTQDWESMGEEAERKIKSLLKKAIGCEDDTGYAMPGVDKDERKLLEKLRDQELKDQKTLNKLFNHISSTLNTGNKDFLLILAYNAYDLPADKDADDAGEETESFEVFRYFCCVACPTKVGEHAINFSLEENKFKAFNLGSPVGAPIMGFVYPDFTDRGTNLNAAGLYCKDLQDDFVKELFGAGAVDIQNPAKLKKEAANAVGEPTSQQAQLGGLSPEQSLRASAIANSIDAHMKQRLENQNNGFDDDEADEDYDEEDVGPSLRRDPVEYYQQELRDIY